MTRALASGAQPQPARGKRSRGVTLGGIRLITSKNRLTKAGEAYKAIAGQEADAWQPGVKQEGKKEYAYLNGRKTLVRFRDPSGKLKVTKEGRDYFETHAIEFLVEIPVEKWYWTQNKDATKSYWRREKRPDKFISVTDEALIRFAEQKSFTDPRLLIESYHDVGDERLHDAIRTTMNKYIDNLPFAHSNVQYFTQEGVHIIDVDSPGEIITAHDSTRDYRISEKETRIDRGDVRVATFLDRPLKGTICVPTFLERMGMDPGSFCEVPEGENCVIQGVVRTFQRCERVQSNGERTRTWKPDPEWTVDYVTREFEQAAIELYSNDSEDTPFDPKQWQASQGVTLRMLEWLCKNHSILLLIFHGDRHVTRMKPDNWEMRQYMPVLACSFWSEHCFFYEAAHARKLSQAQTKERGYAPTDDKTVLRAPSGPFDTHTSCKPPFKDQKPYVLKDVVNSYIHNTTQTFYAECPYSEVESALKEYEIPFYPIFGSTPYVPTGLVIKLKRIKKKKNWGVEDEDEKRLKIHIYLTTDIPQYLQAWTDHFVSRTNHHLVYTGESMASICSKAFSTLGVSKRKHVSEQERQTILQRQDSMCAICGAQLTKKFEVDHIVRLADRGNDTLDNKQGLCISCHTQKTMQEEQSSGTASARGLESVLSPSLLQYFSGEGNKPPQFSTVAASQQKRLEDEDWRSLTVQGFDVNSCRPSALTQSTRRLPVFCVADNLVPLDGFQEDYDFYWCEPHKRLVWCEAVKIYMEIGLLKPDDITAGTRASRHIDPAKVAEIFQEIKDSFTTLQGTELEKEELESRAKKAVLAVIGYWSIVESERR